MVYMNSARGFTLIQIIRISTVIVSIGILVWIVCILINGTRITSRDERRVADIKQIQNALELYYADNRTYPSMLVDPYPALVPKYLSVMPTDPSTGAAYAYAGIGIASVCTTYHLGATLEDVNSHLLHASAHLSSGALGNPCDGSAPDFSGTSTSVYDVRP